MPMGKLLCTVLITSPGFKSWEDGLAVEDAEGAGEGETVALELPEGSADT